MLRSLPVAAAFAALIGCASPPPPEPQGPPTFASAGTWTFDYDASASVVTAVLRSNQGALLVEVSCQAPAGPIMVLDWTFAEPPSNEVPLRLELGGGSAAVAGTAPGSPASSGGVRFPIALEDPALVELFPGQMVAVTSPSQRHVWDRAGAEQLVAVANACAPAGS